MASPTMAAAGTAQTSLRSTRPRSAVPLSLAAIAFAGAFGFLHYITKGPNTVSEHDEEKAAELSAGKDRA